MASEFWLIVGLGNPGAKYRNTRHNMGFMTVNELAKRWSIHFANLSLLLLGRICQWECFLLYNMRNQGLVKI